MQGECSLPHQLLHALVKELLHDPRIMANRAGMGMADGTAQALVEGDDAEL